MRTIIKLNKNKIKRENPTTNRTNRIAKINGSILYDTKILHSYASMKMSATKYEVTKIHLTKKTHQQAPLTVLAGIFSRELFLLIYFWETWQWCRSLWSRECRTYIRELSLQGSVLLSSCYVPISKLRSKLRVITRPWI